MLSLEAPDAVEFAIDVSTRKWPATPMGLEKVFANWPRVCNHRRRFGVCIDAYALGIELGKEFRSISRCKPPPKARVRIGEANVVVVDDKPLPVKPNGYKLMQLLCAASGDYVPITSPGLRTRDVEALPEQLRKAVECDPGAGTRLRREYLA